ncbi:MAG: M20/M25/M40 family metallo-hydrolase [Phycisphaeraceae bacterium]|nr:MAG: M20/M25/M40 family metallo-hydrolase [Phycisphaeraceae bacterium]
MKLTELEQKIADNIAARAEALLDDLRLHVNTPTGKGHKPGLDETRERFTARLAALGATVELFPGERKPDWLIGGSPDTEPPPTAVCRRTREGLPRIMIAGHLDTVHDPESNFRELTIGPDGKTATGPGCVDMKGGLVIAVAALEALEDAGADTSWTFFFNSDEETGSYHSRTVMEDESRAHDLGLALEPALPGGELAIERMGAGQFMIECRGRSAHVGRAFTDGVSAVNKLAECLVEIAKMPDPDKGRILNVGPLQGGSVVNAVPDLARAWGNVRYPTPEVGEEIGKMLDALATATDAVPSVAVLRSFNRPAKPMLTETEALGLRAREVAEALGQKLPFAKTGGVCDGNIMQNVGLPTIDTLGVRGGGLHTPDEWIDLSSLVERCQLLAILIHRLCSA